MNNISYQYYECTRKNKEGLPKYLKIKRTKNHGEIWKEIIPEELIFSTVLSMKYMRPMKKYVVRKISMMGLS